MDEGGQREDRLGAADAARAEAEAAAEAELGPSSGASTAERDVADVESALRSRPIAVDPASQACPFLRLERGGVLGPARPSVDPDHRCGALPAPVALSDAQQSLVCLVAAHVDCPRYLHGTGALPPVTARVGPAVPRPTLAAATILAASLLVTLAYTAASGGLSVPLGVSEPGASIAFVPSPSLARPSVPPPSVPSPSPAPTPRFSPSPPAETPSAAASASPPAARSPSPTTSAGPSPISDRYALLRPCPDRPGCYIYTVRAGDNLTSIGLYFGVPFDTILRLNPWIRDPTTIHQGEQIVLPPPSR